MKWCRDAIKQKKIKMNSVSDNFKCCHIFNNIILIEAERVVIDHYLIERKESLMNLFLLHKDNMAKFTTIVAAKYIQYLESKVVSTTDKELKTFV